MTAAGAGGGGGKVAHGTWSDCWLWLKKLVLSCTMTPPVLLQTIVNTSIYEK